MSTLRIVYDSVNDSVIFTDKINCFFLFLLFIVCSLILKI